MIELDMHYSSDINDDFIPSFLDPKCCNCPFMPDKECGWGYRTIDECVFQLKGTPYWLNVWDGFLNEKLNTDFVRPINDVNELINFLELAAQLHLVAENWNWDSKRHEFLDDTWVLRKKVNEYGYEIKTGHDYVIWSYLKEPCVCCGEITENFVLYGNPKWFGSGNREGNVIKLCEHCSDAEWMSSYGR